VIEPFRNKTSTGEAVNTSWDTKDTSKVEKMDPTTEALWEVEWYAHRPSLKVSYLMVHCVFRRKPSAKKNKTWEGDGLLHQIGFVLRFLSEDGSKV